MARKSNGWVKIHSKILKENLTPSQFKFFVGSIVLANPPSSNHSGVVDLTISQLSKELTMSRTEIWRRQQELAQKGMITLQKRGFLINKYNYYQTSKIVPPTEQDKSQNVSPAEQKIPQTEQNLEKVSPTEHFVPYPEAKRPPKKEEVLYKEEKKATTSQESEILKLLKSLKGWSYKEDDDLEWLRELVRDFNNVTILNIKACRDYHSDKPAKKGPWKNRIRQWLGHDIKFEAGKPKHKGAHQPTTQQLKEAWGKE